MYLNKNNVLLRKYKEVFMSRGVRYLAGICLAAGVLLVVVVVVNMFFGERGAVSNAAVNGEKHAVMDLYDSDYVYTNSGDYNIESFSAGQTSSMKYSAGNADRGIYRVKISSQSGSKLDGALKVSQL